MRLAHLILVHNNPRQLQRLITRLTSEFSDVYIHVDKKAKISDFEYLALLPNIYFIKKRVSVSWGDFSMVDATLKSFQEILSKKINYSHINLLSGQDYLLKSIFEIENFLFKNANKSFIQSLSIYNEWQESRERLTKYSIGDFKIPFKFIIQDIINKLLPDRKMPDNLEPYGVSQWIIITPICAKYVIDYLKKNPKSFRFFKRTWAVDEILFQTVLLNSPLKDSIVNDNLRFIKFENQSLHPRILKIHDAEMLINSNKFFARKFSLDEDSEIFDFLDNVIK